MEQRDECNLDRSVSLPGEVSDNQPTDGSENLGSKLSKATTSKTDSLMDNEIAAAEPQEPKEDMCHHSVAAILQKGPSSGTLTKSGSGSAAQQQWINGMWYASQEVERRREQQASFMFDENRRLDSLKDIVDAVQRNGLVETKSKSDFLIRMAALRTSSICQGIDIVCSLFLVYGMDIYLIATEKSVGDDVMQVLALVCLILVIVGFVMECCLNRSRSGTAYLILDFLSIMSFIPSFIWWGMGTKIKSRFDLWAVQVLIGCIRAGKIVRLSVVAPRMHLVALERAAKRSESSQFAARHCKSEYAAMRRSSSDHQRSGMQLKGTQQEDPTLGMANQPKSHIGLMMNRQMVHHAVALVFLLVVVLSGHDILNFSNDMKQLKNSVIILERVYVDASVNNLSLFEDVSTTVFQGLEEKGMTVIFLELNGVFVTGSSTLTDSLRSSPPSAVEYIVHEGAEVHLDLTEFSRKILGGSLYLCLMSNLVMFGTTWIMHRVLHRDVIRPFERMVAVIAQLAQEPLAPVKQTADVQKLTSTFETKMVESAIYKFASLLQLAFGEAGASIIRDNSSGGVLNQNMTGKVIQGIFGFCDVRNFTTLTEVLQGDVVKIVNGIASIVHAGVCENYGAPNKNIGDAFLLVWKPKGDEKVMRVAEAALRSYIRIILEMQHSDILEVFCRDPHVKVELQRRLGSNLRLKLGFGLHYGWAIECAIGSACKIDASYLSPHVNLASRLEAGTKQYGVDLLISSHVHQLFGPNVQALCRLVDRVTFKGSDQPTHIYTYDVPGIDASPFEIRNSPLARSTTMRRKNGKQVSREGDDDREFFSCFPPLISDAFRSLFADAIEHYLGGMSGLEADWHKARAGFEQCLVKKPGDGPSTTLLAFINANIDKEGSPGRGWPGYRHLEDK
mmetsp:Transcript_56385/g.115350  ORF Transcript_56385/g.115350 Transcript_56385/m.115350 type:complete len:901 (+) Transcript_56385:199-2901(+)